METIIMTESGMNWVKKRPGTYVLVSLFCLLGLGMALLSLVNPSSDSAHDSAGVILGLLTFLFFFCIAWVPVFIRNSNATVIEMIPNADRLIIKKDRKEVMNAAWANIKSIRSQKNGRHIVGVDINYVDDNANIKDYHLQLAYFDKADIDEMAIMLKDNWYDKYGNQ